MRVLAAWLNGALVVLAIDSGRRQLARRRMLRWLIDHPNTNLDGSGPT